jgi:nicotinamide riboside kinase
MTQPILSRFPNIKFRVLIVGRESAGKASIMQKVADTTESPVIYRLDKSGNPTCSLS